MAIIPDSTLRVSTFTAASTTTGPFNIGFRMVSEAGLLVYVNGVARTDFAISAVLNDGFDDDATLTFAAEIPQGSNVAIFGGLIPYRSQDYQPGDPSLTRLLNAELTQHSAALVDLWREVNSSIRIVPPAGSGFAGIAPLPLPGEGATIVGNGSGGFKAGPVVDEFPALAQQALGSAEAAQESRSDAEAAAAEAIAAAASVPRIKWRGDWQAGTEYIVGDAVFADGSSFVATSENLAATVNRPLTGGNWSDVWDLLVTAGGIAGAGNAVDGNLATFVGNTGLAIADSGKALPEGDLVGTTGPHTLRQITLDLDNNAPGDLYQRGPSGRLIRIPAGVAGQSLVSNGTGWSPRFTNGSSFRIEERKGPGVNGGTFRAGGFFTRQLSEVTLPNPKVQVADNTMFFLSGLWEIRAVAVAYRVNINRCAIAQRSGAQNGALAISHFGTIVSSAGDSGGTSTSEVYGTIDARSNTVIAQLQHRGQTERLLNGFGLGSIDGAHSTFALLTATEIG